MGYYKINVLYEILLKSFAGNDATIRKLKNDDVLACPFPASRPGLTTDSNHFNDGNNLDCVVLRLNIS